MKAQPNQNHSLDLSDGGSGGSFGASPLEQHIGLGKAGRILNIEVWWPSSNTRQNFPNIAKNQFLKIKEFAATYTKLERKSFRIGGENSTRQRQP